MNNIEWFNIKLNGCPEVKEDMKWYLTVGITDDGVYYCPLEYAQQKKIDNCIMIRVILDEIPLRSYDDHLFVPMDWLRDTFPYAKPMVDKVYGIMNFHSDIISPF